MLTADNLNGHVCKAESMTAAANLFNHLSSQSCTNGRACPSEMSDISGKVSSRARVGIGPIEECDVVQTCGFFLWVHPKRSTQLWLA